MSEYEIGQRWVRKDDAEAIVVVINDVSCREWTKVAIAWLASPCRVEGELVLDSVFLKTFKRLP